MPGVTPGNAWRWLSRGAPAVSAVAPGGEGGGDRAWSYMISDYDYLTGNKGSTPSGGSLTATVLAGGGLAL